MSGLYYKNELYPLQDEVLRCIGKIETPFYLTGGTVVSRFLLNHRYSDDLDFFLNHDADFAGQTNRIIECLKGNFADVRLNNLQDSFARISVVVNDVYLKIEFVNDVKHRVGVPLRHADGFFYDTWENILSNKLTAISSRTAGKDFVDILFLSFNYQFNWKDIINHAKLKDAWVNEINISQSIMNFDVNELQKVFFREEIDIGKFDKSHFGTMARDSLHGFDNSLYKNQSDGEI